MNRWLTNHSLVLRTFNPFTWSASFVQGYFYNPASALKISALSVLSQGRSRSSLPKCP